MGLKRNRDDISFFHQRSHVIETAIAAGKSTVPNNDNAIARVSVRLKRHFV